MSARIVALLWLIAVSLHLCVIEAGAQALSSGSNGSDGALTLTTPGEVIFDPVAMGLDADRDNVFHFTTITIGPGVIVRMLHSRLQGAPVVWLATGAVQIAGIVDLNGQNGVAATPGQPGRAAEPGPGGYPGGVGAGGPGFAGADLRAGLGPGGGPSNPGAVGTHAGHAVQPLAISGLAGAAYGNALGVPLRGGSGGGGGGDLNNTGGSGGGGGGAIRIFSSTSIVVDGGVAASGGSGGAGQSTTFWGGGGGSGGSVHLIAPSVSGTGTLSAPGGAHGNGIAWSSGSSGRVRIDAYSATFNGSVDSFLSHGTPYNVPLPSAYPIVRVTSVAGIAIASTTGDVLTPDASINESAAVPVTVEARNIPVGTVLEVRIISEAVPEFVVNTTPLTGTLQQSTATADVTFPPGFSRGWIRATWNPPTP